MDWELDLQLVLHACKTEQLKIVFQAPNDSCHLMEGRRNEKREE